MFWISTKRIITSGFVGFWRNGFVSLASILIMVVTLFSVGSVIFLDVLLTSSLQDLQNKVDVNVYFLTTASEEEVLDVKRSLEGLPEVASVDYISREQALIDFRLRHENDQLTIQALDELDENPLGAILNVRAFSPSQYQTIAEFLDGGSALGAGNQQIIDKVNFFDNQKVIDRLSDIINSAERLGFIVSIVLVLVSIIITLNTIRLAIYTAREEISVMRLVGASNFYIRGPFVVAGVMYGVIAALIVLVLFYPITLWLGPHTERFFTTVNIFGYYVTNFGQMFLILMGTGIVLGAISSYLAVRRYLKV